ncbi:vacuolar import and degradation protein-domain-containing protein [Flagelloscypha sp. PMI_526]|nr:vacuolar import and degradation protein-domain-containing protein [Flagelloscypha sp. PMI_526]
MPSEHIAIALAPTEHPVLDGQVKSCSICQTVLVDPSTYLFDTQRDALVCLTCRNASVPSVLPERQQTVSEQARNEPHFDDDALVNEDHRMGPESSAHPPSTTPSPPPQRTATNIPSSKTQCFPQIDTSVRPVSVITPDGVGPTTRGRSVGPSRFSSERLAVWSNAHDPLTDITRLRVRTQAHHCLYPGSIFEGQQQSGRTSYDVTVTICDVDFNSSFLCGYLCIRGLTPEFPELTTYFDAEIIGSRYGFLTDNGLSEERKDLEHWQRFAPFRHLKHELRQPRLTMPDRDRGAVFMRWKERFLVPDHRVESIHGASFAGFYYVCVDFNPPSTPARTTSQQMPQTPEDDADDTELSSHLPPLPKEQRTRRGSSVHRGDPTGRPHAPVAATMTGFYHHKNSEPYQKLTLEHVPARFSQNFEFR